MHRELTFEKIATTEDTGEPVIHAELPDTNSYLNVVIGEDQIIRVTHVESFHSGDMKIMLDEVTSQLESKHVRFMVPLGKELGSDLEDHIYGFEKITVSVEAPDGGTMQVEALDGEWDYERD